MAMTFDTEEEAIAECEKLQKEWKSELKVSYYSED
jgi:predicted HTH domain antitoxin